MSTNREEMHRITDELSEAELAEVLDFARARRARAELANEGEGDLYLDGIAADPERLARFRAALDVGLEQAEGGEGRPASEVFADLRKRTQARREQG